MRNRNYIIAAIVIVIIACVGYGVFIGLSRAGKQAIEVLVSPEDASVYIDNKPVDAGTVYVTPEKHTFKASHSGWSDDTITLTVSPDIETIALVLNPASAEAREYVADPSITAERESLAGIAASVRGATIRDSYPIIDKLPYSDLSGPFKIDFGFNADRTKTPYLIISYATPHGRHEAIAWLRDNDVNLTHTEVVFEDFINPLQQTEKSHD